MNEINATQQPIGKQLLKKRVAARITLKEMSENFSISVPRYSSIEHGRIKLEESEYRKFFDYIDEKMKTKTEILKEFCEKEFEIYSSHHQSVDGSVGMTSVGCGCCADYKTLNEENLNEEIDEATDYLDHLIKLRDDMKGRW